MMKTNRILLILSALLIFISCSNKKENEIEPITFTMFSADLTEPEYFNNKIAKEITKRTGVTLEFIPNYTNDGISIMLADDYYPDLIYAKGDLIKIIEKKGVIPLDDLIEKYGTNIKKLYGSQIVRLRNTLEDPHIYSAGTYEINTKINETSGNMQLQHAVLKEFGYPQIKTLDDFENILKAYKAKYPEINGQKTIGLSLLTDSWFWYLGLSNPGNYVIGYPDDGQWIVDQNNLKATYKFLYPEMNTFYKWLNKLYNEGLLDPESFTQNNDVYLSKLKAGNVLSTSYPFWGIHEAQISLSENGMEEHTFAYLPVTADDKYKDPSLKNYGFSGGWGIAISKNCKDPLRAFKFLDWMCSEEAQILNNWGIEGEHYYYDGRGRRIFKTENADEEGIGHWVYPFPQGGGGYIDSTGNPLVRMSKENLIKTYTITEKETLKAYGVEIWPDLFPQPEELGVSRHGQLWQYPMSSQMTEIVNKTDAYVKECLIKMIVCPVNEFDSQWELMQNNLRNSEISKVEENLTNLIQNKMKLWGEIE